MIVVHDIISQFHDIFDSGSRSFQASAQVPEGFADLLDWIGWSGAGGCDTDLAGCGDYVAGSGGLGDVVVDGGGAGVGWVGEEHVATGVWGWGWHGGWC